MRSPGAGGFRHQRADQPPRRAASIVDGIGLGESARKSRWPARLDLLQSTTGLVLVLFMWGHMFFVASSLLGAKAMWTVTRFFEGYYLFGKSYPGIVSVLVAVITLLFFAHALLGMRKLPSSYGQYRSFQAHRNLIRHDDTTLWWVQVVTGAVILVLGPLHLYQMLVYPEDIGPYASADRVWTGRWWPTYLVLLISVELHAGIGIYRLAVKWGWLESWSRRALKRLMWGIIAFFLSLGLLTLAHSMQVGYQHRDNAGERYLPDRVDTP